VTGCTGKGNGTCWRHVEKTRNVVAEQKKSNLTDSGEGQKTNLAEGASSLEKYTVKSAEKERGLNSAVF